MDGYIKKGHRRKVPENVLETNEGSIWYPRHHAVLHSQNPEKVRVVFNYAAKCKGTSVNDKLLRGPNLNINLVGVLI